MLNLGLRLVHQIVQRLTCRCTFPAMLLLLILAFPQAGYSQAPSSGLYGLSFDGDLFSINLTATPGVQVTNVRPGAGLPSYPYYNLTYYNNKFYTVRSGGTFYRFGLTNGDEENLGTTSAEVTALAVRPSDQKMFAVTQSGSAFVLKEVVISGTPPTVSLINPISIGPYGNNYYNYNVQGMAFYRNDVVVLTRWSGGLTYPICNVYKVNMASNPAQILAMPDSRPNRFVSVAIEPTNQKLYVVNRAADHDPTTSQLWEYNFSPSSPTNLGTFYISGGSSVEITALAFVPLSTPLATPTPAPTYTPSKIVGIEPIRKKLMGE
jgi:hypothetical protein